MCIYIYSNLVCVCVYSIYTFICTWCGLMHMCMYIYIYIYIYMTDYLIGSKCKLISGEWQVGWKGFTTGSWTKEMVDFLQAMVSKASVGSRSDSCKNNAREPFRKVSGFCHHLPSQLGGLFPIYGKIKVMFQSPPTSLCSSSVAAHGCFWSGLRLYQLILSSLRTCVHMWRFV